MRSCEATRNEDKKQKRKRTEKLASSHGVRPTILATDRSNFYVLLTVHLGITLDNDQLDTHLFYFILQYVYYNPLHVSSIICSS